MYNKEYELQKWKGNKRGMADSIEIRLSEMRDASALMEIDSLVWNMSTTPAPIRWNSREQYLQKCPPGNQLVADINGTIGGYIGFEYPTTLPCHRHVLDINIAVHPDYQRQGIGGQLIEALKVWAARQGVRKLSLRVLATNPGAIEFYRSCGFTEQGRLIQEFYLNEQYVDDILMYCMI
ncbi:GNAT family N-acetyltransferase [Paenibacillus aceti]|uniref:N-acetyltransferase n=2 Tax=Paenibacillus aceti TaxID=1820010 RepID=A0ABQ1VUM3_9BACL|nr:GNAT family N-acetyltransferase [Paenibacillus aceti]GGF95645.1 N-acetyltransferase [Paenibacillus aceti]